MENSLSETELKKRSIERKYPIRGDYFRDQTAIIHSMPFRRLKHKTQVFFAPENDHICTRIEHVLHVASIATTICKGLNQLGAKLNPELAFAIGLGHDLGHAPFGHAGEEVLTSFLPQGKKFIHELNSYRVVEHLFNFGRGLNLTYAVKDGIICHNGESFEQTLTPTHRIKNLDKIKNRKIVPSTFEGCIVRFSDKIAYLGRDLEDAKAAYFINNANIPKIIKKVLGTSNSQIIGKLVKDIIDNSKDKDYIGFSDEIFPILNKLYQFNSKKIYHNSVLNEYKEYAEDILRTLYEHFFNLYSRYGTNYKEYFKSLKNTDKHFGNYLRYMKLFYENERHMPMQIIIDYIAGMTDNYALACMEEISIPRPIQFKKKTT